MSRDNRTMKIKVSRGGQRSRRDLEATGTRSVIRELDNVAYKNTLYLRKITSSSVLATNGSGFIPISTLASSASVSGLSDFSSAAGLYLEYRVKAMKAMLFPINAVNISGVSAPPAALTTFNFSSGVAAVTYQQALDSSGSKTWSGYKPIVATNDYKGNKDAQLWTPTTAAVTAAEAYGIAVSDSGVAPASPVSTTMFRVVTEYLVEFRSAA